MQKSLVRHGPDNASGLLRTLFQPRQTQLSLLKLACSSTYGPAMAVLSDTEVFGSLKLSQYEAQTERLEAKERNHYY